MKLQIRFSLENEIKEVKWVLMDRLFWEKYGYNPFLPQGVELNDKYDLRIKNIIKNDFIQNKERFKQVGEEVLNEWNKNERILSAFFNQFEYKKPETIEVWLTAYGPGGSYYLPNKVSMRLDNNPVMPTRLATFVHEVIHLCIEDPIVNKYKLSSPEKESVVDYIFNSKILREVFPDYKPQRFGVLNEGLVKKIGLHLPN